MCPQSRYLLLFFSKIIITIYAWNLAKPHGAYRTLLFNKIDLELRKKRVLTSKKNKCWLIKMVCSRAAKRNYIFLLLEKKLLFIEQSSQLNSFFFCCKACKKCTKKYIYFSIKSFVLEHNETNKINYTEKLIPKVVHAASWEIKKCFKMIFHKVIQDAQELFLR